MRWTVGLEMLNLIDAQHLACFWSPPRFFSHRFHSCRWCQI
jgi:hypothetical protein